MALPASRSRDLTDEQWGIHDGSFKPVKKGGLCVDKTKRGRGTKIMAILTAMACQWRCTWIARRHLKSRWSRPPARRG